MSDGVEIDYTGDGELYAVVCRPRSGKTYIHLLDEEHHVHGKEPSKVTSEETTYIPEGEINDTDE